MMWRSLRSAKSVAWIRLNVIGVSMRFFLPRRVTSRTSGEEFHSLKYVPYPSDFEPRLQQRQLRALAGAVDALHDKEPTGKFLVWGAHDPVATSRPSATFWRSRSTYRAVSVSVYPGGAERIIPLLRRQARETLRNPAHVGRRNPSLEVRLAPGAAVMKSDLAIVHGVDEAFALEVVDVALRSGEEPARASKRGAEVAHGIASNGARASTCQFIEQDSAASSGPSCSP